MISFWKKIEGGRVAHLLRGEFVGRMHSLCGKHRFLSGDSAYLKRISRWDGKCKRCLDRQRLYVPAAMVGPDGMVVGLDKLRAWEERQRAAAERAARVSLLAMLRFLLTREWKF